MTERGISLVIPTWNGKHILEEFLPSVFEACRKYKGRSEIIVVDDGSTDSTAEFLQEQFPQTRVLSLSENRGYGYASNWGVINSNYDLVVLLNNDVWIKDDFLNYIPSHFDKEDVFAVRFRLFRFEDKDAIENGTLKLPKLWSRGEFKYGFIYVPAKKTCPIEDSPHGYYSFNVGAGAFAVDKKKWLQIGGFDDLFYPFYAEDTDISYRVLKRGWKIIYEPKSIYYHKGGGFTISKSRSYRYIKLIGERNRYFLVWKNITDAPYLLRHFIYIPLRLIRNLITGNFISFLAFFYGLWFLPTIYKRRKEQKRTYKLRDKQIFDFFQLN